LRWAARAEGVVHLEDLLLRRVRLGLLLPQGGLPWLERIRGCAQPALGWSDERWAAEAAAYAALWRRSYGVPGGAAPAEEPSAQAD
jgi:glycerol-3-phosphate dehydrogenase